MYVLSPCTLLCLWIVIFGENLPVVEILEVEVVVKLFLTIWHVVELTR